MTRKILLSAVAAFSLVNAADAGAQRSAGESVDDTTIAMSVKSALVDSDVVEAGKINVEVYKRTVQLSGYVPTEEQKAAALQIADGADGVDGVEDALIVMAGKRSVGRTIDDETINGKIKLKIAEVSGFGDAIGVVTHVRNGEVLLGGFVETEQLRKDIVAAAESLDGVLKVHDRMAVKP
ncbi:MAG TPA: BON domain-containing protein [Woeseiaceae bacterium]|nr:BON domain-containing protein [Woeseiaceae bacterium]